MNCDGSGMGFLPLDNPSDLQRSDQSVHVAMNGRT